MRAGSPVPGRADGRRARRRAAEPLRPVRCDRGALLLPLASASGQDRLELRVMGDGAYRAVMAGAGPAMTLSGRF